jgi:hypothetical protein
MLFDRIGGDARVLWISVYLPHRVDCRLCYGRNPRHGCRVPFPSRLVPIPAWPVASLGGQIRLDPMSNQRFVMARLLCRSLVLAVPKKPAEQMKKKGGELAEEPWKAIDLAKHVWHSAAS